MEQMASPHWGNAPQHRLWAGITISLALHALLLTLNFKFPEASRTFQDKALDIILVNSRSAHKPSEAQALAQANLDGGGNVDENRRVTTPLPPSRQQKSGSDLEQTERRVQALEAQQQRLLTKSHSKNVVSTTDTEAQPAPAPQPSGRDLANSALAMARFEGEIARDVNEYNKRPRKKNIGTRVEEYRFAQYVEDWRNKVERVGTLNYPEAAKGKLFGSLILSVTIRSDGTVDKVIIDRPSGHRILDEAARRIVQMAAPYAAFPPDIRRDFEILEITRTLTFTNSNLLDAKSR